MPPVSWKCLALLLAFLVLPRAVHAQGLARTLDELRLLVRPGQSVTVVDAAGGETSGKISALSPTALELQVRGQRREWQEGEIATIRQRHSDSLANGALWGLGIGAGLATVAIATAGGVEDGEVGWALLFVGFYGGAGAGIGVGIDALIRGERVVYQKAGPSARWQLSPLVTPRAQGARLTLRF